MPGLLDEMRKAADEAGRDADAIEVTAGYTFNIDDVKRYEDLGVTRLVIPPLAFDPAGFRTALERFQGDVISQL